MTGARTASVGFMQRRDGMDTMTIRSSSRQNAVALLTVCLLAASLAGCLGGESEAEEAVGCQGDGAEDSDFDGVPDCEDQHPGCDDNGADMNGDGIPDECES